MGGSGGGRYFRSDELSTLARIAREKLQESAQLTRRNVFISFAQENLQQVSALRAQAKNENSNLEFIDRSLDKPFDSDDAEYIRRGLRERIRQASVTVCYVSEDTAKSEWVNWEIEESIRLGKGVIAIYQGDKPPANIPAAIRRNNINLVPWNQAELMKAIEKAATNR